MGQTCQLFCCTANYAAYFLFVYFLGMINSVSSLRGRLITKGEDIMIKVFHAHFASSDYESHMTNDKNSCKFNSVG